MKFPGALSCHQKESKTTKKICGVHETGKRETLFIGEGM
jgi:hypothetical protein